MPNDHELKLSPKMEKLDKPILYVGQIIGNDSFRTKVVYVDENNKNNIKVEVLDAPGNSYGTFGSYLDVGKIYKVYQHKNWKSNTEFQVWEISSRQMKRKTSQILLFWDTDHWEWEMDS